jgi:hypothetical protein
MIKAALLYIVIIKINKNINILILKYIINI